MNDTFHLPDSQYMRTQIFQAVGLIQAAQGAWQTWNKPRGCSMLMMVCIGAGASGAGGNSRASLGASVSAGGGSGGCAGMTKLLIPAAIIPDRLFISVGVGNAGGAAGGAGFAGMTSYISAIAGNITAANLYLASQASNPVAPSAATTTGPAGGAGTTALQSGMLLSWGGLWSAVIPVAGVAGSVGAAAGTAATPMVTSTLCGGGGGGGALTGANTATAGGLVTATGLVPGIAGGTSGANPVSNGNPGWFDIKSLCGCGGTGGGSLGTTAGTGGDGGAGGIGCGGGGGGQGVTGGKGGKGGNGIVIITAW